MYLIYTGFSQCDMRTTTGMTVPPPSSLPVWGYCSKCWASFVAHMVKNLPAVWETWVWSLGREDPLEKGMTTHCDFLAWRIPWTEFSWWATVHGDHKELDTTEWQTVSSKYSLSISSSYFFPVIFLSLWWFPFQTWAYPLRSYVLILLKSTRISEPALLDVWRGLVCK